MSAASVRRTSHEISARLRPGLNRLSRAFYELGGQLGEGTRDSIRVARTAIAITATAVAKATRACAGAGRATAHRTFDCRSSRHIVYTVP
jgi:hypothetical protein